MKYHLFRIESFRVDFRCVHRLQFQGLRSARHPSKFSRRTERIRGTIQVRLSFQIDGFVTDPSQFLGDTQPMNQTERSVL